MKTTIYDKKWPFASYNFFKANCNYLYLGAKQKRPVRADFFGHMYSHYRADYTIFYHTRMWLNYIKKINLMQRLFGADDNHVFFITNRMEHLRFLDYYADRLGINTLFYTKAAQYSFKCGAKDEFMAGPEFMRNYGVKNYITPEEFGKISRRVFINTSNSNRNTKDWSFFRRLDNSDISAVNVTLADTNSYVGGFIPFFGNNDGTKSWNFFFKILTKCAKFAKVSSFRFKSTRSGNRVNTAHYANGAKKNYRFNPGAVFGRKASRPNIGRWNSRTIASKSIRGAAIADIKISLHGDWSKAYDTNSGAFRINSNFLYCNAAFQPAHPGNTRRGGIK